MSAALFKFGTDEERLRLRGQHERPETFAAVEAQVGKVDRGTGGIREDDGVDLVLCHQRACTLDANLTLGVGEWSGLAGKVGEGRNRCRHMRRRGLRTRAER